MKIVKWILIVLASLVGLVLIIGLFVSKKYEIKREVVNKPIDQVFDYVRHIKNQDKYSVWNMADPNKKQTFTGEDGTVGFKNYWNGNDKVGEGEQQITAIDLGKRIDITIAFKRPFENVMQSYITTEAAGDAATTVSWVIYGESSYPMNVMNLMLDGMLGKDLQGNLDNLKKLLEKQ
ncbi:MAG: SRPBCC family protein [Bacteroidota bacterium]